MEGALAAGVSIVMLLGVLDVGMALLAAQGVQRSADAAASAMASGATESEARARAVAAAPGFMRGCIEVSMQGWPTVTEADFGGPGAPVGSGTRVVRLDVACDWGWLTPGVRMVVGPTAVFRATAGAALP
jgi:hypothetical protein